MPRKNKQVHFRQYSLSSSELRTLKRLEDDWSKVEEKSFRAKQKVQEFRQSLVNNRIEKLKKEVNRGIESSDIRYINVLDGEADGDESGNPLVLFWGIDSILLRYIFSNDPLELEK